MRYIVFVVIAIVALIAMRVLKQHRGLILVSAITAMTLICGLYSFRYSNRTLASMPRTEQTFYSPEFLKTGEFPDAFLRLFLEGKTVYVKNDLREYDEELVYIWKYDAFHGVNVINYLESVNANVILDDTLNNKMIQSPYTEDFDDIGYANDLLRNTTLYTKYDAEWGNYFAYVWYYRDLVSPSNIYVNEDGIDNAKELVLIWQPKNNDEEWTEDLYIMSMDYYNSKIK